VQYWHCFIKEISLSLFQNFLKYLKYLLHYQILLKEESNVLLNSFIYIIQFLFKSLYQYQVVTIFNYLALLSINLSKFALLLFVNILHGLYQPSLYLIIHFLIFISFILILYIYLNIKYNIYIYFYKMHEVQITHIINLAFIN
jgi:hypothetical protein